MRTLVASLAVASVVALAPVAAWAGYAIVDHHGGTVLVSRGRIKQVPREAEQAIMVFDIGRDRLWLANPRTRSYWEGTSEEFCAAVKGVRDTTMSAMEAHMQEQLAKLPPDQRAMVTQRMRQARGPGGAAGSSEPAPRVTVERTTEEAQVGGQTARKFRVLANGQPAVDVWLGNDQGLVQELMLAAAPDRYARLAACVTAKSGGSGSPTAAVYESAEYRTLYGQGWPLRVVTYAQGAPQTVIDVARVERRDIPEAEFTVPAGFRKATVLEVFGATAGPPGGR